MMGGNRVSMSFHNVSLFHKQEECFAAKSIKWGHWVLEKMKCSFDLICMEKDRYLQECENFIRIFGGGKKRWWAKEGREETGERGLVGREASNNCPVCEALTIEKGEESVLSRFAILLM